MANDEDLARLRYGAAAWNNWRAKHPERTLDLRGAKLSEVLNWQNNLIRARVSAQVSALFRHLFDNATNPGEGASAREPTLKEERRRKGGLAFADLRGANLSKVDLRGAHLCGANLSEADLKGAILVDAHLEFAILSGTDIREADLSEAILWETVFADVDLSVTKGLETCKHKGPSVLDHRTLQRSGRLPLVFLRGCGLPDKLIDYLPSLLEQAIQYYSCFISYSSKDEAFANRLHADLQNNGVRCWFAPEDMKIGDKFRTRIDEAIHIHERLLLILSENSVSSQWVEKEVETAFEKEQRQRRTVLFPVRLDNAVMESHTGWSADIRRTRHIGDFSRWKDHDSYQQAFKRVLRDLKAMSR